MVTGPRKELGTGLVAASSRVAACCHESSEASKESQDVMFRLYSPSECVTLPVTPVLMLTKTLDPKREQQRRRKLREVGKRESEMQIQGDTARDTETTHKDKEQAERSRQSRGKQAVSANTSDPMRFSQIPHRICSLLRL